MPVTVNSKERDREKLINKRPVRKALSPCNVEEELVRYRLMMERKCSGLTTRSVKLMTFELAIKMVLPIPFRYSKEQKAGSGSVTLCAAILD